MHYGTSLVLSESPALLVLGWDGLGVSSYFLVVYYENNKSMGGGLITVISNRVGDVFIVLGVVLWLGSGSMDLIGSSLVSSWLGWLIVLGGITKSAMYPYSAWLPEAMAAPTPVSSLVHSSTLVTAGVWIIFRFHPELSSSVLSVLGVVGLISLLLASLSALVCKDLKKIVALSTLSQLSFMVVALALVAPYVGVCHLISHALFKSSLFLAVGVVIHYGFSSQEARTTSLDSWSGSSLLALGLPLMALSGVPSLSGFSTKELIIVASMREGESMLLAFGLVLGAILTLAYSWRIVLSGLESGLKALGSSSVVGISVSVALLMVGSIVGGGVLVMLVDSGESFMSSGLIGVVLMG